MTTAAGVPGRVADRSAVPGAITRCIKLAIAYPGTAPAVLVRRGRAHLRHVTPLRDALKTRGEHRRLLTAGGWLSLLAAPCMPDLGQRDAASAHLTTAAQLAREAE